MIVLSPFQVNSTSDVGYQATESMAGTRLNTELRDIASQVTVMTPEFLQDLAITSLDDALLYSLNTETDDERIEVNAPGNAGIEATTRPFGQGGRTRGLGSSNRGHDFFDTFVPLDAYNTERFTFASGPNSILFGNANPSGTIDTSFKRARLNRSRYSVEYRIDDNGSNRVVLDLNQPIVKNILGLRLAGLRDRQHNWRSPSFSNSDRGFASLVYQPFRKLGIRAFYEKTRIHNQPVRNTLLQDHVTPWLNAGSPAFDNGLGHALPSRGTTTPFQALGAAQPYYAAGQTAADTPITFGINRAYTRGFDTTEPAPNNFEHSIIDEGLYPFDLAYSGNADQALYRTMIRGAIAELNPLKDLFIEVGLNEEKFHHQGSDLFNNAAAELQVDPNLYLSDRVTPNPNYGKYMFQSTVPIELKNYSQKRQRRISAAYELDFTDRPGWQKWLGRHRIAAVYDNLETIQLAQRSDIRIVGDTAFTNTTDNSRLLRINYYIDPDRMTVNLPFDPLSNETFALPGGLDANGEQVYAAAWGPDRTPGNLDTAQRYRIRSRVLAMQNFFLNGRIATAFGERRDGVTVYDATPGALWIDDAVDNGLSWNELNRKTPITRLKSIVVHPFKWLSAFYSESNTEQVSANIKYNLDGSLSLLGAGKGEEYGLSFYLGKRLSLRIAKYTNSAVGSPSNLRRPNPVPTVPGRGDRGNIIRIDVASIEKTLYGETFLGSGEAVTEVPAALRSETYYPFQQAIATGFAWNGSAGSGLQETWDFLSDRVAEGYELTLVGNPTPNWRVSVTAAKNNTKESNIGPQYFDFVQERLPVWANYLTDIIHYDTTDSITVGDVVTALVNNMNYIRLSEGQKSNNEREYRVIATTRYSFSEGRLKGAFAGANYSWRSPVAVGYQTVEIDDNPFVIPGVISSTITVNDIANPIYGKPLTTFDVFLGYNKRLFQGKVNWLVQLNVRNALDNTDLVLQRTLADGTGVIYTPPTPRTFILTNTFTF